MNFATSILNYTVEPIIGTDSNSKYLIYTNQSSIARRLTDPDEILRQIKIRVKALIVTGLFLPSRSLDQPCNYIAYYKNTGGFRLYNNITVNPPVLTADLQVDTYKLKNNLILN